MDYILAIGHLSSFSVTSAIFLVSQVHVLLPGMHKTLTSYFIMRTDLETLVKALRVPYGCILVKRNITSERLYVKKIDVIGTSNALRLATQATQEAFVVKLQDIARQCAARKLQCSGTL